MKKLVLIYGLLAAAVIALLSYWVLWTAGDDSSHYLSEWLGYLIMVLGLSVIFVAVKQHRDHNLGGIIGFGKAFQVGLFITLMAALIYVLAWEYYYRSEGQDFIANYQSTLVENMREEGSSEAEIQKKQQELTDFARLYDRFYFRAFITLLEILPVGLLIALFSAALLRTQGRGR